MVLVGPGVPVDASDRPVSTRRIFHTVLDWAGLGATGSLRVGTQEIVLGEAMKPFLEYGWLPQIMVIDGPLKGILTGNARDVQHHQRSGRDTESEPERRVSALCLARRSRIPRSVPEPLGLPRTSATTRAEALRAWAMSQQRRRPSFGRTRRAPWTWCTCSMPWSRHQRCS